MANAVRKDSTAGQEKFLIVPVLVLMLAQMGTSGENGAMAIAAASLTKQLGASMADIQLANVIYPLVAGASMVAGGMLGIIIGWKKNLRIGLALASIGELIAAFAPNMFVFTWVGRLIVGVGASLLVPSLLGMVPTVYKSVRNRALAFGCIGAAMGIANVLPLILGLVMDAAGFRVTFGLIGAYFGLVLLASFGIPKTEQSTSGLKFDFIGSVFALVGLFLLLLGISRISVWGLIEPMPEAPFTVMGISPAPVLIVLGLIVLAVMFSVERKIEEKNGCALIPRSFYETPQVLSGLAGCAGIFVFNGAMTILMVPYLQLVAGWNALSTGLITIAYGIPMFIAALGQPKLLPQLNPKVVLKAGYLITAVATLVLSFSFVETGITPLVWFGTMIAGIGSGLMSAQASNVVALAVNDRDAAQSGGVQATARNVSQAIAIAGLGSVLLFGISGGVVASAQESAVLSPAAKEWVADQSFSLTSDAGLVARTEDSGMDDAEVEELVSINARERVDNVRIGMYVTAVVLLLLSLSTRGVTVTGKEG